MPTRSSFLLRLFLAHALVLIGFSAATWWMAASWQRRSALEEVDRSLVAAARLAGDAVSAALGKDGAADTAAELGSALASMGKALDARLTLILPNGDVLADSDEDPQRMTNHSQRPEVLEAIRSDRGTSERYSDTLHKEYCYLALAIRDAEGELLAVSRAAIPMTDLEQRVAELRRPMLGLLLLGLLIALAPIYWTAARITRPLRRMTAAAEEIARGGTAESLRELRQDEVGDLSRAMITMATRLQDRLELLATERNKLVAVLSGMVEGVLAIDRDENVLHINEAAARMLNIPSQHLSSRSLAEITRFPPVRDALQLALKKGETAHAEVLPERDGTHRVLTLTASALHDAEGVVQGAVLVLHDVTELRRLETVRQDFVANVSHELKTPLAALRGVLETMAEDPDMPREVQHNFLDRARRQTDRLTAIVTDLLTLSRLEGAKLADTATLDACALVAESVERFQEEISARGIRTIIETARPQIAILGEAETFRQIVDNLLSNAIRYSPQGGEVTLRLFEQQGSVILEVQDHGIGIDPAEQNRIFERFYRADRARSREQGGTGLGLSIVKHATELLGGQVNLRSWPGSGSCFRIRLPKHAEPPAPARGNPTEA